MNYTFRFTPVFNRIDELFDGVAVTLGITAIAIAAGFVLGVAGALVSRSRHPWARRAVHMYVEVIRNTPLLAQLFFVYFGLPGVGLRLDAFVAALITLIVNLGAYTTEIVRGGIDAVPRGQIDAGTALGLTRLQVFFLIVLKPALQTMFPALASQFTLLMLSTSILSQIGVTDLFHMGSLIHSATYRSFEVYAVVCGFYLVLALAFRALFAMIYWAAFTRHSPARNGRKTARPAEPAVVVSP
jgi:polar amino acid transport system permease protein